MLLSKLRKDKLHDTLPQNFLRLEVLHEFTENVYIAQVVDMFFYIIHLYKTVYVLTTVLTK